MAGIIGFKRPLHSGRPSYDRAGSLQRGTGNVCHLKPDFSTDPLSNRNPRDQESFDEHRPNHPASSSNRGLYHRNKLFAISLAVKSLAKCFNHRKSWTKTSRRSPGTIYKNPAVA